jgi:hypothetical protein
MTEKIKEIEQQIKRKIENSKEFERLILNEKQISVSFTSKNTNDVTPAMSQQVLLGITRAVRGIMHLALNAPVVDEKKRELLLKEVNTLPDFGVLFLSEEEKDKLAKNNTSIQKTLNFITIAYDKTNKNKIAASVSVPRDCVIELQGKVLGIYGLIEEFLLPDESVLAAIKSYTMFVRKRIEELKKLKESLEDYIADESLRKFSRKFREQAKKLRLPIGLLAAASVGLFLYALHKLNSISYHFYNSKEAFYYYFLIRFGTILVVLIPAFYLLRYAVKLYERKNEYENKALVLSTFPALNFFLEKDSDRFELIKTLILENQKLWTLSEGKDSNSDITKTLSLLESFIRKK